jgi:hypothetical protein
LTALRSAGVDVVSITPGSGHPEPIDLDALTDEQREGLVCIHCGQRGGPDRPMRPIPTPHNRQSTMVFAHIDDCVRPLDADQLRGMIAHALREHPDVADVRPAESVWSDRVALAVEDCEGGLWRIHILREARR